ncbi:hypothetical protein BC628DRAFT_1423655 [Trametes gibbosa]|nr:hypothetical protein BC628DRAFT_1423655 [Trametes gibbosa]
MLRASSWGHIQGDDAMAALTSLHKMEVALLHELFSQHGSLFFVDDRIGPTVDREWWRHDYARVEADFGPWPNMPAMMKSAVEFQLRALDSGAVDLTSSLSDPPDQTSLYLAGC